MHGVDLNWGNVGEKWKIYRARGDVNESVSGSCDYLGFGHEPKNDFKCGRLSGLGCSGGIYWDDRELECQDAMCREARIYVHMDLNKPINVYTYNEGRLVSNWNFRERTDWWTYEKVLGLEYQIPSVLCELDTWFQDDSAVLKRYGASGWRGIAYKGQALRADT